MLETESENTMPDLLIGCDSGASLTKALYLCQDKKIQLLTMEPEVITLPCSSVKSYREGRIGAVNPEDDAWVQCSKKDSICHVVGFLARNFNAFSRLDLLKYEQALYKIMAVVGAIWEKSLFPKNFSVGITAMLPANEYVNREQLFEQLKKRLKNYYFRDRHLKADLVRFDCLPEGGGIALARMNALGFDWFTRKTLVVLMFGHRDTSCLVFQRGVMKLGETALLGFYQLVDKVIGRTSGQSRNSLTKAIYEIGEDINAENEILRTLIKSEKASNVELEAKQLASAIKAARKEYWVLLQNWIDATLPEQLHELVITGGSAQYLRREIFDHLEWANPHWNTELQVEIKKALNLESSFGSAVEANALSYRLIDVYGSFTDLIEKHSESA